MTIQVAGVSAPGGLLPEQALQALYLLPSAPRALVIDVYWHLVSRLGSKARSDPGQRAQLEALHGAYRVLMDAGFRLSPGAAAGGWIFPAGISTLHGGSGATRTVRVSPWQALHVLPDAPPDVVELALTFWRTQTGAPPAEEAPRAADAPNGSPADDGPSETRTAMAHLRVEDGSRAGSRVAIPEGPFAIGSDPACDLTVASRDGAPPAVLARLSSLPGRVLLHAVSGEPPVLVNGERCSWVVLEDGDRLQLGDETFVLELPAAPPTSA